MKTLKFIPLVLLIMTLVSFTGTPISIASSNDDSHLSANDSTYSPPGYMNKDIQQARTLTDKYLANKDKAYQKTEATQRDVSQKVEMQAVEKPKPQLKQKQSSRSKASNSKYVEAPQGSALITDNYKVAMKTGELAHYEGGRLVSEYINGIRHIYVGFADVGYRSDGTTSGIQKALNESKRGDVVLVAKGTYVGNLVLTDSNRFYGGFDGETGQRGATTNKTTIKGTIYMNGTGDEASKFMEVHGVYFANGANTCGGVVHNGGIGYVRPLGLVFNARVNKGTLFGPIMSGGSLSIGGGGTLVLGGGLPLGGSGGTSSGGTSGGGTYAYYNDSSPLGYGTQVVGGNFTSDYMGTTPQARSFSTIGASRSMVLLENPYSYVETTSVYQTTQTDGARLLDYQYAQQFYGGNKTGDAAYKKDALAAILTHLNGKDGAIVTPQGKDAARLVKALRDTLEGYALAVRPSMSNAIADEADALVLLGNILKNPTEGQKVILDSVKSLLNDINRVDGISSNQSPELKKASDDLLQMVASVILAQGVPDLLKSGDVSNIKSIFQELDQTRAKIMLEYTKGTKPYYENMIKDMAKNMAMLHGKNLLNPNITKDELSKLPPSELDKILEKIKNMKDRSFEEEYLLQQESKYRKDYLDPNKKKLENDMKDMLKSFTGRLNDVLKSTEKK